MRSGQLLKKVLLVCVLLFAMTGQAIASPLLDALNTEHAGDYEKAAKLFISMAERGDETAQIKLCGMSERTKYKYQNESVKWCRQLAEQGDSFGQWMLGEIYEHGKVVPQDYKEAVKWYRLAAEQGDSDAQSMLAISYDTGHGIPQNFVLAHMWMNISAANANDEDQKQYIAWRDGLAKKMTAKQISEAQELAKKCTANKFKGC